MNNVMVDIETLSTKPNAVIVQIAAAFFDINSGQVGETFCVNIDPHNQDGRSVDVETCRWWQSQNPEVRKSVFSNWIPFTDAITKFNTFLTSNCPQRRLIFWCNGLSFDAPILNTAFAHCGFKTPWMFYNERDLRTLMKVFGVKVERHSGMHNALADVEAQIKNLIGFLNAVHN